MTVHFRRPERTDDQLKALAASGSTSFARAAQEELRQRVIARLARVPALARGKR